MALPDNINTGGQRVRPPPLDTAAFKTRLEPRKHRPPTPSPPSTSSSPSPSVPYRPSPNMFTTPTKATSRMANKSPFNKVHFTMRRSPIVASPFISPGGYKPVSPPSLFQYVNSSPVATPTRRRYTPTRFLSPKTPKSHRGRTPAQSQPRKERSFQSLEKSVPSTPEGDLGPSFTELTEQVHAASAKAKVPIGQEADIFFIQLGKLDTIRSITSDLMNARISASHASHNLEAHRKPRREHQLAEGVQVAGERLSKSPQKRDAIFLSQRKKLREEAILKEEFGFQRREPDSKKAGPSQERPRQSPESVNKLKRKQQAHEEEEVVREKARRREEERNAALRESQLMDERREAARKEAARVSEEERLLQASARLRQGEEAARLQAQETERLRHYAEVSRLRAEEDARLQQEATARRRLEEERQEQEFQERLRRQAQTHAEQEEKARRLEAEEEVRRKAEIHARWRLQEQKEQSERLEQQAREEAQRAHLQAEQARAEAEHARLLAEHVSGQARLHAEEQARIHAEQQARLEAQRQAEYEANFRAYERAQALAAEEARIRAIAESVAQMQAELNARAQAAFGGGASWHNPHEHYEFNRYQQQQQEQQNHYQYQQQQHHHHHRQQSSPSSQFQRPHQQTYSQQHQQQSYEHHDTDVPMRDPSIADINMDASMSSIPDECPTPGCPSPELPPPPPPPPAPLTKSERIAAYHAKWRTPIEQWGLPIGFQQFPWPVLVDVKCPEDITFERLREFYMHHQSHTSAIDHRKTARAELKRWHSDKIDGKFSGKLDGSKPMIDAAVKEITRFLHEVLSNM